MLKGISAYKPNGHRARPVGVLVSNDFLHLVGFRPTHLSNDNLFKTLNLSNTHIRRIRSHVSEGGRVGKNKRIRTPMGAPKLIRLSANSCCAGLWSAAQSSAE